jgi:hypothetical protein
MPKSSNNGTSITIPAEEWDGFEQLVRARLQQQMSRREEAPADLLTWAQRYRRLDGQPFTLDKFRPLKAIYQDNHPHIVIQKPAQRGVSEYAVNRTVFALDQGAKVWTGGQKDGLNVGYIFPTQDALRDFSKERFSGLLDESDYLAALFADSDFEGVTFKKVGRSYLYLRGGWSKSSLLSFPADMIVIDEFDQMDPKSVVLARRRMNASDLNYEIDLSTPTIPGRGINAAYIESDQRVYKQICPHCGEMNQYDFFRDTFVSGEPYDEWKRYSKEKILRSIVYLRCPMCKGDLTDADRCVDGEWEAQEPEITARRGYLIPPLAFSYISLQKLAVTAVSDDPDEITEFYRSDLGLPYEPGGSKITMQMLAALSADLPGGELPRFAEWRQTTMGVDVGSRLHYRVSSGIVGKTGRYVRAMGSVTTWDELQTIFEFYGVRRCVVDALPEVHSSQEWANRTPMKKKVYRAFYAGPNAMMKGQSVVVDDNTMTLQINRTSAMDGVFATVASGSEFWPRAIHDNDEVIQHLTAPVRVVTLDSRGQERATWIHTQPDHLFHASLYDRIAFVTLPKVTFSSDALLAQGAASGGWSGTPR